jgi:hypothetical protein
MPTAFGPEVRAVTAGLRAAILLLVMACAGCSTECQLLCTAWYDYQLQACGAFDVDDERVRCISDYSTRLATESELAECTERTGQVQALGSDDPSCCPGAATADCPWVDELPAR